MKLDYSPLVSAVAQLQRSFDYLHSELALEDSGLYESSAQQPFKHSNSVMSWPSG